MKVEKNVSIYTSNPDEYLFVPFPSAMAMTFEKVVFANNLDERICYWALPANIEILQQVVAHKNQ